MKIKSQIKVMEGFEIEIGPAEGYSLWLAFYDLDGHWIGANGYDKGEVHVLREYVGDKAEKIGAYLDTLIP